jgi:hypothetical protein
MISLTLDSDHQLSTFHHSVTHNLRHVTVCNSARSNLKKNLQKNQDGAMVYKSEAWSNGGIDTKTPLILPLSYLQMQIA